MRRLCLDKCNKTGSITSKLIFEVVLSLSYNRKLFKMLPLSSCIHFLRLKLLNHFQINTVIIIHIFIHIKILFGALSFKTHNNNILNRIWIEKILTRESLWNISHYKIQRSFIHYIYFYYISHLFYIFTPPLVI